MNFNLFGLLGRKNTAADAVVTPPAGKSPIAEEPRIAEFQTEFGKGILSMTDAQAKANWEKREKIEAQSQIAFRLGVILYEKHSDIPDTEQTNYAYDIADFFSKYEDARNVMNRIEAGEHPSKILEDLKKNMTIGNVVGVNSPAP